MAVSKSGNRSIRCPAPWSVCRAFPLHPCVCLPCSQFVNMLDLINHRLSHAGVRCVKLDGGMTVPARDRVIQAFRDDPHVTVFLISLKAGGVALNLTAASRIYLMDPWYVQYYNRYIVPVALHSPSYVNMLLGDERVFTRCVATLTFRPYILQGIIMIMTRRFVALCAVQVEPSCGGE